MWKSAKAKAPCLPARNTKKTTACPGQHGLTIQAATGQLDDAFTPLQLATYCATIANDGVRLNTHLLDHITDYNREQVLTEYEPTVAVDTGISPVDARCRQSGMREVVLSGTAESKFGDYGIAIAAKTGTAGSSRPFR